MKVVCCQLNIDFEDKQSNYAKVRALIDTLRPSAGSLIVLPEMFATGFSMNVQKIAEKHPAPTEQFLGAIARVYSIFIVAGLVTIGPDGKGRNEAIMLDPDGKVFNRYSKIHPFSLAGEPQYYTPGDVIAVFSWLGWVVAPFICYDLRFPEVFRAANRRGAHLFTVIANWPSKREAHWIALLKARAIENQAYVVGVNRCGIDPQYHYGGKSVVIDPMGEVIAEADDKQIALTADIDLSKVSTWRKEFPALQDARMVIG